MTVSLLILAILGGTIYWETHLLRVKIRNQTTRKDAEHLHAVALMQQISGEAEGDLGGQIENFADQFNIALQISQLKSGIIAARLFDRNGKFITAFPGYITGSSVSSPDLQRLRTLSPVSHYHPHARLSELFLPGLGPGTGEPETVPLLEVGIPLHRQHDAELAGVAQFIIEAKHIEQEFAALDRSLMLQAGITFLVGGLVILGVISALGWSLARLERSNQLLTDRTERLLRANQQLALSARTSAVGAVTAYLIHGLSNPLSGLKDFLSSSGSADSEEWNEAAATTTRMQQLIEDVVRVLGEEHGIERYELTLPELVALLLRRNQPDADARGVALKVSRQTGGTLPNRDANLVLLILDNLVQNAIHATPAGRTVSLTIRPEGKETVFEVADQGPGFPAQLLPSLFSPCRSSRKGGSGIGLAISKQLAHHLGASLSLSRTSAEGCVFSLRLQQPAEKTNLAPGKLLS